MGLNVLLTAKDIARYFLTLTEDDSGEGLSNLKLQKLVYYAQGFHLAIYGEPLFSDEIQAWQHGPVVPTLYRTYKIHGSNFIPVPDDVNLSAYSDQTTELLNEIYQIYGQFSAWKLRDLTHQEPTWSDAYKRDPGCVISHSAMKTYFETRLTNDQEKAQKPFSSER